MSRDAVGMPPRRLLVKRLCCCKAWVATRRVRGIISILKNRVLCTTALIITLVYAFKLRERFDARSFSKLASFPREDWHGADALAGKSKFFRGYSQGASQKGLFGVESSLSIHAQAPTPCECNPMRVSGRSLGAVMVIHNECHRLDKAITQLLKIDAVTKLFIIDQRSTDCSKQKVRNFQINYPGRLAWVEAEQVGYNELSSPLVSSLIAREGLEWTLVMDADEELASSFPNILTPYSERPSLTVIVFPDVMTMAGNRQPSTKFGFGGQGAPSQILGWGLSSYLYVNNVGKHSIQRNVRSFTKKPAMRFAKMVRDIANSAPQNAKILMTDSKRPTRFQIVVFMRNVRIFLVKIRLTPRVTCTQRPVLFLQTLLNNFPMQRSSV